MSTSQLLPKFNSYNALTLYNDIINKSNLLYAFIGKTSSWDDDLIPEIEKTLSEEIDVWKNMNGVKLIQPGDVCLAFRKIEWFSGSSYDQYDDQEDLSTKNYYVVTDENKVYKCISNNNKAPSVNKPIHTSNTISLEPDGYKWKYLFTIPQSAIDKFINPDYSPLIAEENDIYYTTSGSINHIVIESPGDLYPDSVSLSSQREIPVFIEGDGDQNFSAELSLQTNQGVITSAEIINNGENYPYSPESRIPVAIRQSNANGVIQSAYGIANTDAFGQISDFELIIRGNNYVNGSAQIVQSSARAYAESDSNGRITSAEMFSNHYGANFTNAKAIIVASENEERDPAVLRPIISPIRGHGSDIQNELYANNLMINVTVSGESSFIQSDNFRQIGIIKNPLQFVDTTETDEVQINLPLLPYALLRAVVGLEPEKTLFSDTEIIYENNTYKLGDVNKDGNLNSQDALEIEKYINNTQDDEDIVDYIENVLIPYMKSINSYSDYYVINNDVNISLLSEALLRASAALEPEKTLFIDTTINFNDNEYKLGDVNRDGNVNSQDALEIEKYINGEQTNIDIIDYIQNGLIPYIKSDEKYANYYYPEDTETKLNENNLVIFNGLIGDARYKVTFSEENTNFEVGETIFGETSKAQGTDLLSYNTGSYRFIKDTTVSNDLEFIAGETVRGLTSGETATISEIIPPDVKPYSGEILYINNKEVIERNTSLQLETVTLVVQY